MKSLKKGTILITVIVFSTVAITVVLGLVNWGAAMLKSIRMVEAREQAFQIAEAGIDYYRWHLAHDPEDFTDNTDAPGPYVHHVYNKLGEIVGEYSLEIEPPSTGSTIVKITSTGTSSTTPPVSRTLKVSMAIPSWAKFAVVANADMYFGPETEVFGPIHSNGGIHFDGVAHNLITSAKAAYNDLDFPGGKVFGVYTTAEPEDPEPPAEAPLRPDIFEAGREFPVEEVDFDGISKDLSEIKTQAIEGGHYYPPSGKQGYRISLKENDTYDFYKVMTQKNPPQTCRNTQLQDGWGTWSIENQVFVGNYPLPDNGIIFLDDHVWVDGKINTARITIAVGRFPEAKGQYKNITINENLLYTNYDGSDVIGLIAQGNINIGLVSAENLRIDAALIAQNGRVGRYYYTDRCGFTYNRTNITLYGMMATNLRYGFKYTDGTGYDTRTIIYDTNLLFSPPPSFPLSTDQYEILSWQEI